MNENISRNKWKYATIGLMGILALGFAFPQAFAAASVDNVFAIVKDIQAKVNALASGTTTNTSNILSAITGVKNDLSDAKGDILDAIPDQGVRDFHFSFDPEQECCGEQKIILPNRNGFAYVGHLSGSLFSSEGEVIEYRCVFPGGAGGGVLASQSGDEFENFSIDFACPGLRIYGYDPGDPDTGNVSGSGRVSFTQVPYSEVP